MFEISTVLCPVDFTPLSGRAVALAIRLCRRFGARLVLEHNLEPGPPSYLTVSWMWSETHKGVKDHREEQAQERLRELLEAVPREVPREARLTKGPLDQALLLVARELGADLVVMGTHGGSSAEHRSLTELVIAGSPCPVLTTTEECGEEGLCQLGDGGHELQLVVPVDFSLRSRAALAYACELAGRLPCRLHLVHVAGAVSGAEERALEQRLAGLVPDPCAGRADWRVMTGAAPRGIAGYSREVGADVIVMGVRPKNLLQRLASGTTAFDMLHDPTCPVWFVPAGRREGHQQAAAG
jgi:nucleotide-binding universal stress UspA family protein